MPGLRKVRTEGDNSAILAFLNPDKSLIVITCNKDEFTQGNQYQNRQKRISVTLEAHSFNTFKI